MSGRKGTGWLKVARGHVVALLLIVGCWAAAPAGAATCPNEQLRAENNSTRLPDCRAYELVTPGLGKEGYDVGIGFNPTFTATNGDGVLYNSVGGFEGATHSSGNYADYYAAQRGPDGWRTTFLSAFPQPVPATGFNFAPVIQTASSDLSVATYAVENPSTGEGGVWLGTPDGGVQRIAEAPAGKPIPRGAGVSADGSHVIVRTDGFSLVPIPGEPTLGDGVQLLFDYSNGAMHLVNSDNSGHLLDPGGAWMARDAHITRNDVSADGSRVFFYSRQPGDSSGTPQLYMRLDGKETFELSASTHSAPAPAQAEALFAGASTDGVRSFFASTAALTDNAVGGGPFLYEYHLPIGARSGVLKLIAGSTHPVSTSVETGILTFPSETLANVIVSDDGSQVYYVSTDEGGSLFDYDTSTEQTTTVVTHAPGLRLNWNSASASPYGYPADVSDNGNYLAFSAAADLVPGDTNGDEQIYVYNNQSRTLALASTGPAAPSGSYPSGFFTSAQGAVLDSASAYAAMHFNIVNDKGEVFFTTPASLVPQDSNGHTDVYEWQEGRTSLISGGRNAQDSGFLGASADGANLFFWTYDQLVPVDGDDQRDIYDARVEGGFPQPKSNSPCRGEGCQGPAGEPPARTVPGSTLISVPAGRAARSPAALRREKLAKALKACKAKRGKKARVTCERKARKRYGMPHETKQRNRGRK